MADIYQIGEAMNRSSHSQPRGTLCDDAQAEIIIFPGVRYDRSETGAPKKRSGSNRKSKVANSKRRK